jgi:hypothetical protein
VGGDETFFDLPILVLMELASGFRAPGKIDVPIAKTLEISWLILNSAASFSIKSN